MKLNKLSAIAVAVLAGGTISASAAAKTQQGSSYELEIDFSNSPPSIVSVSDIPQGTTVFNTTNDFSFADRVVDTDGSGKIDGAAYVRLGIGTTDTNNVSTVSAFTDVIGDVSGKVSSSGKGLTITERYKGTGYSAAAGSNGVSFPNISAIAGAASVQINFKSTAAPVQDTNSEQFFVTGTLTGSLKPGSTSINGGKSQKINETATLRVNNNTLSEIFLEVVQLGDKFQGLLFAGESGVLSGSGSVSGGNKIKATLKGHGSSRGASVQLSGSAAALSVTGDTNGANSVVTFANPVTLKGKAQGQTISGTSTSVVSTGGF